MARKNPPETCTDHYLFWKTRMADEFPGRKVRLAGPNPSSFEAALLEIEYLGNPARKTRKEHEPEDVHHPSIHLLAYKLGIHVHAPEPVVKVTNQFSDARDWKLGTSQYLFIPARKAKGDEPDPTSPPPPRVDHFLCYEASGPDVKETFRVEDQFGVNDFVSIRPILFGFPADKNDEGLVHPEVHLAIYQITPVVHPPAHISVRTYDQLGPMKLNCIETAWLAVPSYREKP